MLKKNDPFIVDNENPFKDDCLDRKVTIQNLTNLLKSLTQPFVLSIEAPWGTGKTTYIHMWRKFLSNQNHPSLYFNAWESDYSGDPLIAFLGEMNKLLKEEKLKGKKGAYSQSLQNLQNIGIGIAKNTLPIAVQVLTHGLVSKELAEKMPELLKGSEDSISDFLSDLAKDGMKSYESGKNDINKFKLELEKFARLIQENEQKSPLVIFVDELDRCRPTYAIDLLERIKHLFNVKGVVFILSVDRKQLENTVESIYGANIDSDGYLAKFIDLRFTLPEVKTSNYVKYLTNRYHMNEVFQKWGGTFDSSLFQEQLIKYFDIYHLSLRTQEQVFTLMNIVLRVTPSKHYLLPNLLPLLLILKVADPTTFDAFVNKMVTPGAIFETMPNSNLKNDLLNDSEGGLLEGLLAKYLCTPAQQAQMKQNYKEILDTGVNAGSSPYTAEHLRGFVMFIEGEAYTGNPIAFLNYYVKQINILDEIRIP